MLVIMQVARNGGHHVMLSESKKVENEDDVDEDEDDLWWEDREVGNMRCFGSGMCFWHVLMLSCKWGNRNVNRD